MKESAERMYSNFLIPNICIIVMGLGVLGVGIWMNAEHDVQAYLYVFGANPNGNILLAMTALFIVSGIFIIGAAVCGIFGIRLEKPFMLTIYILVLVLVMILLIIVGFLAVGFRETIYDGQMAYMQNQVQNDYTFDNNVGKHWNRVQIRLRCCGADSAMDYRCSSWWLEQEGNSGYNCPDEYYPAPHQVPDSCCVLELNQDRDPERVPTQNPIPKNKKRCNEDVAGNMWSGSSNVNERGCFSALQDQVFLYIYVLMGMGFVIGLCMLAGIIIGIKCRTQLLRMNSQN